MQFPKVILGLLLALFVSSQALAQANTVEIKLVDPQDGAKPFYILKKEGSTLARVYFLEAGVKLEGDLKPIVTSKQAEIKVLNADQPKGEYLLDITPVAGSKMVSLSFMIHRPNGDKRYLGQVFVNVER